MSKEIYPLGYRYRKNYKKVPSKPDIAFVSRKLVIFIDGDFWHGYEYEKRSKKYSKFWKEKIKSNMERDQKNRKLLKKMGWTYIIFWEHKITKEPKNCIKKILKILLLST